MAESRIPPLSASDIRRFRSKVLVGAPDSCWEAKGYRDKDGYVHFKAQNKDLIAHRIAHLLAYGDPGEFLVCHTCDNPPCCNPFHLFKGTALDNNRDKVKKGRAATGFKNGRHTHPESTVRGERVNTSKITEAQAREAIMLLAAGVSGASIGRALGITKTSVWAIKTGRNWKHLPRPWTTPPKLIRNRDSDGRFA